MAEPTEPIVIQNIFQILISKGDPERTAGTSRLQDNIETFRRTYPDAQYRMYDNDAGRGFLQDRFGARVTAAYDALAPLAFKADLLRYCLVHEFGGLYSDLAFRHLRPITSTRDVDMIVFQDQAGHPPWSVNNGLIYAKPGNRDLARIIRQIVRHAANRYYGYSAMEPTGPYLFGRTLAQSAGWHRIDFGTTQHRYNLLAPLRGRPISQRYKRLAEGTLVAIKEKFHASTIAEYVGAASNNYAHVWRRRQVWGEPETVFHASDVHWQLGAGVMRRRDALEFEPGHAGLRLAAPMLPLPDGKYRLCAKFSSSASGTCYAAVHNAKRHRIARIALAEGTAHQADDSFVVASARPVDEIQITVHSDVDFSGALHSLSVKEI